MTAITKTTVGLNLARDGNSGAANPKITYVSLGTGTTAPTSGDVKLANEVFRKRVTSYSNGATGEILISMYVAPGDAVNVDIEEVGFWSGNATNTPNSGVMLARGLWSHNFKTAIESINFVLDWAYS